MAAGLLKLAAMAFGAVLVALAVWASIAQQAAELYAFFGWWGILIMVAPGTIISLLAINSAG